MMQRLASSRNQYSPLRLHRHLLTDSTFNTAHHQTRFSRNLQRDLISSRLLSAPPKRPRSTPFRNFSQCRHTSTYVSEHFRLLSGDVERYLESAKLKFQRNQTHALVKECPFCPPTKGRDDNMYKLNILLESGVFNCYRCHNKGSWFDFKQRLRHNNVPVGHMEKQKESKFAKSTGRHSISSGVQHNEYVIPKRNVQENYRRDFRNTLPEVKAYLHNTRGLLDNVLDKYGVGATVSKVIQNDQWIKHACVTFPMYDASGKLVRHKIRSILTKSGMRLSPKGGAWGLFGLNTVPEHAEEVIITEGEFDAMAVYQNTALPTISLPNGASSLPVDVIQALERFKTIYLWMDQDAAGLNGMKQFSRKLGIRRCLAVSSLGCKDANDALLQKKNLQHMIDGATVVPHEGIITFEDIRKQVQHELCNASSMTGVRSHSLPGMNKFLSGLRGGELTIYSGHTGVGKTTLLSQLSLDYCMQGTPTLWGSFEVINSRLAAVLMKQFWSAHGRKLPPLEQNVEYWGDQFSKLPMYFMAYHGSNDIQRVIDAMEYANYVHDCTHIVLDNLQFMASGQAYGLDRFAVYEHAITQIREFCTTKNVHVSLVVHPRKEDDDKKIMTASVFGSAKATQEADNVIVLQREKGEGAMLEVLKNRYDGSRGGLPLRFNKERKLFEEKGTRVVYKWAELKNPLEYAEETLDNIAMQLPKRDEGHAETALGRPISSPEQASLKAHGIPSSARTPAAKVDEQAASKAGFAALAGIEGDIITNSEDRVPTKGNGHVKTGSERILVRKGDANATSETEPTPIWSYKQPLRKRRIPARKQRKSLRDRAYMGVNREVWDSPDSSDNSSQ